MKITISKSELFNRLKSLSRIIQPKNTLIAYDSFLFDVNSDSITITSGEEAGRLTTTATCQADGELSFTVPAKTILDGLKDIPEQPIVLSVKEETRYYTITCKYSGGKGKFTFCGGLAEDYPTINKITTDNHLHIFSQDLLYGINQVQVCVADDELRPVMNGVYIDQYDEKITFVGSNGNILGMVETKHEWLTGMCSFIIPAKFTHILSTILIDDCNVDITTDNTNISFSFGGYTLICRMIEGRYPNYRAVIPANNSKNLYVIKSDILSAIKRVSVFSSKSTPVIVFDIQHDYINIEAHDIDYSLSAEERVSIEDYNGDSFKIGFNANYLKELVSNIPSDKMVFSLYDKTHAVLITRNDEPTASLTYLIMPMQINL